MSLYAKQMVCPILLVVSLLRYPRGIGGKSVPYKNVCVNHIPQIMLEMFCTSTQECHYVVWTPVGTKVFLDERDDSYIEFAFTVFLVFSWFGIPKHQHFWGNGSVTDVCPV